MNGVNAESARWERFKAVLSAAGAEFTEDHGGRLAAALAYYTLFSLIPLLFVVIALTSMTLGPSSATLPDNCADAVFLVSGDRPLDRLVGQVQDVAGKDVADPMRVLLCNVRKTATASLSIGILFAAFLASGIFLQIQGVLNTVFHVPDEKVKGLVNLLWRRAIALAAAIVLAVLVLVPVAAVGVLQFIDTLIPTSVAWVHWVLGFLVPALSAVMLVGVVSLTFRALPATRIPWKAARRGGAVTSVLALFAAFLLGTYLGRVAGSGTLGALGGVAVLLFFFYLMWIVYVFGAELTKVYADYLRFGDIVNPTARERREAAFRALIEAEDALEET